MDEEVYVWIDGRRDGEKNGALTESLKYESESINVNHIRTATTTMTMSMHKGPRCMV